MGSCPQGAGVAKETVEPQVPAAEAVEAVDLEAQVGILQVRPDNMVVHLVNPLPLVA